MKVMVMGDVHGWWTDMMKLIEIQKPDVVLQVGDFGYFPRHPDYTPQTRGVKSPVPLHWCDGNHEDHDALAALRKSFGGERTAHEVAPNVFWQDRGTTTTLPDGRAVLFFGGADSIDKRLRIEGESWFPGEQINDEDMIALPDGNIDIIVSHTCPNRIIIDAVNYPDALVHDPTRERLDEVFERYRQKHWYFGHWHMPMRGEVDGCQYLGLNDLSGRGCFAWL